MDEDQWGRDYLGGKIRSWGWKIVKDKGWGIEKIGGWIS